MLKTGKLGEKWKRLNLVELIIRKEGKMIILFIYFTELWREYMWEMVKDSAMKVRDEGDCLLVRDSFCQDAEVRFLSVEEFIELGKEGGLTASRIYIQGDECPLKLGEWMELIDEVRKRCERYGMVSEWEEIEDGRVEWIK